MLGEMIIQPPRIQASATVDLLNRGVRPLRFRVKVWGQPPYEFSRTYELVALSDKDAAFAGIDRFTAEMTRGVAH